MAREPSDSLFSGMARRTDTMLLITCEHGGNRIPKAYQEFFLGSKNLLNTHRGFDFGALKMARDLAAVLQSPLDYSTVSRLLVDLNRSIGHPQLHCEAIRKAPAAVREAILVHHYLPYRNRVEQLINDAIVKHGKRVIHISSHSFTPQLNGKVRKTDIGLLYDPARVRETTFCERWQTALKSQAPQLTIHRNAPYTGYNDGQTTTLRQRLPEDAYLGIELEINQKHVIQTARHWRGLRETVVSALQLALLETRPPHQPLQSAAETAPCPERTS